jgi:RNA polymerase sigma-70 factor (ECF subfamily)
VDTLAVGEPVNIGTDRAAFAALVEPHWNDMARLARRLAPSGHWEDALQDALSAAWRKRSQYDAARGTARNWLLAIVADQARKSYRRVRSYTQLVDVAADSTDADGDVDLHAALWRLTTRQRTAVALHYYAGLSVAEVGAVLGCSPSTVKSTLADARIRLRRELGEDYRND